MVIHVHNRSISLSSTEESIYVDNFNMQREKTLMVDTRNIDQIRKTKLTQEEFKHRKRDILDGVDLSRKGCIDDPIQGLVQFINEESEFVTTSSCSGRVILFCEDISNSNSKKGCKWLYTNHENVKEDDIFNSIDPKEGNNILKYEPLILHVQCRTLESAKLMHTCALESGFRNSGITLGKHGKIILAVRSCLGLEVPLTEDGNVLVSKEYVTFLTRKANEKIEENKVRTQRFFLNLRSALSNKEQGINSGRK
ncbi:tRNA wybutosine-synthesizing protein 3 homolog [Periplaneta americana]|uniref:tRNA wybutosine-synthesizing protein 3 homolog n=1 Tax=Periplaneta americana TaxID=6978 RepID=UPI0037E89C61